MLGVSKIQRDLYEAFKYFLRCPYTVGFIGGRPKSALYIVGYKENSVIILDSHLYRDLLQALQTFGETMRDILIKSL